MSHDRMTVLVVDDEPTDLEILQKVLAELGYEVLAANDGNAAMRAFHAHRGAIDLLVTDVAMAPMNGCELAANLLNDRPDLRVVFVSGYAGTAAFRYRYGLTGTFAYLRKPFKLDDLRAEVAAVALALG
jgi:CheY-like chemotaxis protein